MKPVKRITVILILAAALAVPWWLCHRAKAGLQARQEAWQQQDLLLAQFTAESQRLSNAVAASKSPTALSEAALAELLKLRNEVGQARKATNELGPLRREVHRLRAGLSDMPTNSGGIILNGLLADELESRRAQVTQLKQWLEENPAEKIPELQLVPELDWIRLTDRPWVATDEENRNTMSNLRNHGEAAFEKTAFKALQQYAQSNHGQFPADVSQLKPFFDPPVDDAVLQRYMVVPANSSNFGDAVMPGDEWLITQKALVNPELDYRRVIGLNRLRPPNREADLNR